MSHKLWPLKLWTLKNSPKEQPKRLVHISYSFWQQFQHSLSTFNKEWHGTFAILAMFLVQIGWADQIFHSMLSHLVLKHSHLYPPAISGLNTISMRGFISISLQSSTVIIIITPTRKSPHVKRHELSILVNPLATFTSLESSIQCSLSLLLPWLPSVLTRSNKHWENNSNFGNDNAGFSQLLRERALYLRRNQLMESFWFSLKAWPNLFNFPLNSWTFMAF